MVDAVGSFSVALVGLSETFIHVSLLLGLKHGSESVVIGRLY